MASPNHASGIALSERMTGVVPDGGRAVVVALPELSSELESRGVKVISSAWHADFNAHIGGAESIDVIVIDGLAKPLRGNASLVRRNADFWRRARVLVVLHVDDLDGHGIALELANLCTGELTIDAGSDHSPFAWIEVPTPTSAPPPVPYPDMSGSLPLGMDVPAPRGVANDYSFISDQMHASATPEAPISVVIPLYNRREMLARTLSCLVHQTYPQDLIEVVIADDGSSDNPLDVIESFSDRLDITYVRQPDEGYRLSEVRNLGVRSARNDWVVLLDCDMAPVPGLVESYARWLSASTDAVYLGYRRYVDANHISIEDLADSPSPMLALPDIVTGNPLEPDDPAGLPTIDWRMPIYQRTGNLRYEDHPFRAVCGGNIAFHRRVFDAAGAFDEAFRAWGAEDAEWGFRVWNRGFYLVPALGACGLHQEPPGGRNETDRELGRSETQPLFAERCPVRYRTEREDGAVHEVPLVSIYMPAYNAERTIVEAVQSALDQTITDLEVCIVDDGSTDRTVQRLEENFGDHPRVRWKSQPNGGIGAASNAAVKMCRGVFIGQLDADDLLRPNAVKFLLGLIERDTRYGLSYGGFQYIDDSGAITKQGDHHPEFSREILLMSMIVHPFRLFRARDWYRTVGFDEQLRNAVDYDIYMKLSEVAEVVHEKKITYQYRQGTASTSVKDRSAQDANNLAVIRASLSRRGLADEWELTRPDPTLPRKVEFRRRSATGDFNAKMPRVSGRIVVEGDCVDGDDSAVLTALQAHRPHWKWESQTQEKARRFRIVGPRVRKYAGERHRKQLKALVDPHNVMSFWLFDADPFTSEDFRRRNQATGGRPLGGGAYTPPAGPDVKTVVLGVTTLNRIDYLRHFIKSFNKTRSDEYHWIVVVADDGSTDESREWLLNEARVDAELIVLENHNQTISGQTNSIFNAALATDFDVGFKCDDDIYFEKPGWDSLYVDAIEESGRGHLVYHSVNYKPGDHRIEDGPLTSSVEAPNCMGCFYTFTREVLETTGYLDESSFPVRGHAHIDFTMRASRLGHNEIETLWDATHSEEFIDLWSGPEYQQTFDWKSDVARTLTDPAERERRWGIVRDDTRHFIPERPIHPLRRLSRVYSSPSLASNAQKLADHPRMRLGRLPHSTIDAAFVLNLEGQSRNFAISFEMARKHGLNVERWLGVDGSLPDVTREWEDYAETGLVQSLEIGIGRKLISSPGAWAYLSGLREMLEHAKRERVRKLLVFDDDVMLAKDFSTRFPDFLESLPPNYVLALLGSTPQGKRRFSRYDDNLLRVDADFNGSYAFIIDNVAFDLLIHEIDKRVSPFDSGPLREVARAFPEDCFAPQTPLAIANVRYSKIRGGRSHREFWREKGHDPTRYEPRRFDLGREGLSDEDFRLSFVSMASESIWDTVPHVRSMLDQTTGNIEVVLAARQADPHREVLEELAIRDPRLRIDWQHGSTADDLVNPSEATTTGAVIAIVRPGTAVSETFAHEHISAFLDGQNAEPSGDGWSVHPRSHHPEQART